jgi:hypothetical protein
MHAKLGEPLSADVVPERDFLLGGFEQVIPAETSLVGAVQRVMRDDGLFAAPLSFIGEQDFRNSR